MLPMREKEVAEVGLLLISEGRSEELMMGLKDVCAFGSSKACKHRDEDNLRQVIYRGSREI